jgi:hypothetical protein
MRSQTLLNTQQICPVSLAIFGFPGKFVKSFGGVF